MKTILNILIISVLNGLFTSPSSAYSGPTYADKKTKEVIEQMIEAHGSYDKWKGLKTMSFKTVMHSDALGFLRFWITEQSFDMATRRSFHDWPLIGSQLTYDGKEAWTVNWRNGNPPNHQHYVWFYYLNLPWLTQEDHVKLGKAEKISHDAFENEVYKVEMSYKKSPILGKSKNDTYTLYIDARTFLLVGYEYTVGYGPLLDTLNVPKDQKVFGPVLRVNTYTAEIDGLKFPALMTTSDTEQKQQYGDHAAYDFKFNFEFDESRMQKPANAVVDTSKDIRKK
ncbi:hypothetical protein [Roseivirga sp. E12]|uniref:hypothetical protein n=1 Tax=Roseivirga sp. E12 TaxID=2819237 RepID=UPI001ABD00B3|nr:hypothetical protein [Roseivirga sp. E12]MBO3700288.1 hypothetical protein [Roseivirga sp. E12]